MSYINCNGKLLDLSSPVVMGVVNATPDSFYDGGAVSNEKALLAQVEQMLTEGAAIIDVGGYSSRPDGTDISIEEEINRVTPAIRAIIKAFPNVVLSIDSFRESVVKTALDLGACIVNDISAGMLDAALMKTVANYQVPYIMMHMRGTPQTMKTLTDYDDLIVTMNHYFSERIFKARELGINDVIIDPGYGFAKTKAQNFELLKSQSQLLAHEVPILSGVSRKSMIYKTLDCTPNQALNGTTALHMVCLQQGASILRVHDVKPAVEVIKLYQELKNN